MQTARTLWGTKRNPQGPWKRHGRLLFLSRAPPQTAVTLPSGRCPRPFPGEGTMGLPAPTLHMVTSTPLPSSPHPHLHKQVCVTTRVPPQASPPLLEAQLPRLPPATAQDASPITSHPRLCPPEPSCSWTGGHQHPHPQHAHWIPVLRATHAPSCPRAGARLSTAHASPSSCSRSQSQHHFLGLSRNLTPLHFRLGRGRLSVGLVSLGGATAWHAADI